jgi:Cu(I)/Ag(I) efflux system membrane fusion protein
MNLPIRLFGALLLLLAGGLGAGALFAKPLLLTVFKPWPTAFIAFQTPEREDPVLFYRDPMRGRDLSRHPKKDGMGMDYLPVRRSDVASLLRNLPAIPKPSAEEPLFYRDPMGGSDISLTPRQDSMGMDYLPVRAAEMHAALPPLAAQSAPAPIKMAVEAGKKRILYYRNPMGLPDTSPVPKKDAMGMDYTPVYEEEGADAAGLKMAQGKIQRTGVRSEPVERRALTSKIRVPGSIQLDERRLAVVATRTEAFIEKVAEVTTGDQVTKGQPLLRLYSPAIATAAADYLVVSTTPSWSGGSTLEGVRRRLETLDAPPEFIREIARKRKVPPSVTWPAARDGIILERNAVEGMKAQAGQILFRIADLSVVWALVDVSERDYARLKLGQPVTIRVRGLPDKTFTGRVALIYPQINKETRTTRVRIELANPGLALRPDMYVDAEIGAGEEDVVAAAPESSVIDTGKRQVVILDKGDGRFEPREVETGRRGDGFVEIRKGVRQGDRVVTAANFLIDAESNLKAALQQFDPAEDRE